MAISNRITMIKEILTKINEKFDSIAPKVQK